MYMYMYMLISIYMYIAISAERSLFTSGVPAHFSLNVQ